MSSGSQMRSASLTRVALAGLAAGAVGSSLLGSRIFAGYAAVGLAAGVGLALFLLGTSGRVLPVLGAGLAMLYPLAASEKGEEGILWAAAATLMVLAAGYVARGLDRGVVGSLALSLAVVLHLGLLGSYLVLVAESGKRLLVALVLMVAAFEVAYGLLAGRRATGKAPKSRAIIDPVAAVAGVVACQAAALAARFFLESNMGYDSLLVLGAVVGGSAALGHASAAAASEDLLANRAVRLDPSVFTPLNSLLFAAGAFYYGFRLYLA